MKSAEILGGGRPRDSVQKAKTLGLCPKPCLGDFLRRSPLRTFKTFTARGVMSLFLRGTDFRCSRFPCCYFRLLRASFRQRNEYDCRLSPLPDRNGRNLVDDWGGTTHVSFDSGGINLHLQKPYTPPTHPTQQTSAKPHSLPPSHLPIRLKTSLYGNRRPKNERSFHTPPRRLPCREVRGGSGRFGG